MGWDMRPHTGEVMAPQPLISHAGLGAVSGLWWWKYITCSALRWITQSGSMWLTRLLANEQPTRSSVDRGHVAAQGSLVVTSHLRVWKLVVCVFASGSRLARSLARWGSQPARPEGGKFLFNAHAEAFPRRVETGIQRFITGESISAEVRRRIWKDKRTQQGFAFSLNCFVNPGGVHGIEPFFVCSDPHRRGSKNTPLLPRNVCGSRVKCGSFCSPTWPIITVQSTNNGRFISTTAQLESVAITALPWALGRTAFTWHIFFSPAADKWSVNPSAPLNLRLNKCISRKKECWSTSNNESRLNPRRPHVNKNMQMKAAIMDKSESDFW